MEEQQNDALLARSPSTESVVRAPRSGNSKAFKVAGFTLLACLLLAGQALTTYFVLGQRQQISSLQQSTEKLKKDLTHRPSVSAPRMMHMPMNSMTLLKDFSEEEQKTKGKKGIPLTRLEVANPLNQKEGSSPMEVPAHRMMRLPMNSMPLLKMAEEKTEAPDAGAEMQDSTTPAPESTIQTKCNLEKQSKRGLGFYEPQCDEEGNYLPMQCWHSTGYCWCVDKEGTKIPDTLVRGRPQCGEDRVFDIMDDQ